MALVAGSSIPFYVLGALGPDATEFLPVQLPASSLMFVCPAAVALWLVRRERGAEGVRALLSRVFDLQRVQQKRWLLASAGVMPAVMLLSYMVQRGLGQPLPEFSLSLPGIAGSFVVFFISAAGEELGLTCYATEPLQQSYSVVSAALIVGTFWALWHIIPNVQAHRSAGWIFWQCVSTVALRVLMVWLFNRAGQSLFAAIVFHAMINVSTFAFPKAGSHYDPQVTGLILTGAALLVTLGWGETLKGSRKESGTIV
jgi:hypothetical protein